MVSMKPNMLLSECAILGLLAKKDLEQKYFTRFVPGELFCPVSRVRVLDVMAVSARARLTRLLAVAVMLQLTMVGTGSSQEQASPYTAPDIVQRAGCARRPPFPCFWKSW